MSALDNVRAKFKTASSGTSKGSQSPSAGSAGSSPVHIKIEGTPSAGFAGTAPDQIQMSDAALTNPLRRMKTNL